MKIVILDGFTINPGDLSWDELENIAKCEIYDRTNPEEVYQRSKDADIIITSKVVFNKELLMKLDRLKYISVIATGYNNIDVQFAREKNILVSNIPNYSSSSVAQMVFAHILEFARHVGHHDKTIKDGKWFSAKDFCYWDFPQIELTDKTLGLIGFGNVAKTVAKIAMNFDMNIIAYDIYKPKSTDIKFVSLDEIFTESDIISLHCPLTEDTKEIINLSNIEKMKKKALLINTARGPLINEKDLANALNNGIIAGAGLDVLKNEPPLKDNPLLTAKNCYISPHIAWASEISRIRLIELTVNNIKSFLKGNPENIVN